MFRITKKLIISWQNLSYWHKKTTEKW